MPRGGKRPGAGRKPASPPAEAQAQPPQAIIDQAIRMRDAGITPDRVLRELASIGFANLRDIVQWSSLTTGLDVDEDTDEMTVRVSNVVGLVDSAKLDPATAAAVAEVSQTKDGALKVKMHAKQPALLALARHLGLLQPAKPPAPTPDADQPGAPAGKDDPWAGLLPN